MLWNRTLIASGAALLVVIAPCAEAYEFPPIAEEVTARVEACIVDALEKYSDGSDCVGVIFDACEGHAETTYSMSACFAQEHEFWQSMITRTIEAVSQDYQTSDLQTLTEEPLSESLEKSQTAWVAFAEAQCRFVYDEAGTGSIRHINASVCRRNLAAERAMFLRGLAAGR